MFTSFADSMIPFPPLSCIEMFLLLLTQTLMLLLCFQPLKSKMSLQKQGSGALSVSCICCHPPCFIHPSPRPMHHCIQCEEK